MLCGLVGLDVLDMVLEHPFGLVGIQPGPSASRTTAGLVGFVDFTGGSPPPSAMAAAASDMSNNVTAGIRFMLSLLIDGEFPGNSLIGKASGGGFGLETGKNLNGGVVRQQSGARCIDAREIRNRKLARQMSSPIDIAGPPCRQ